MASFKRMSKTAFQLSFDLLFSKSLIPKARATEKYFNLHSLEQKTWFFRLREN
jgi:hypothetical protein